MFPCVCGETGLAGMGPMRGGRLRDSWRKRGDSKGHRCVCHGQGAATAAIFVNYKGKPITSAAAGAITCLK